MYKPFAAAFMGLALCAATSCNAQSPYPVVTSMAATPTEITSPDTPFVINLNMQSGSIDRAGTASAGAAEAGVPALTVTGDTQAEWRAPTPLPTSRVQVPIVLVGSQGLTAGLAQFQTFYLQFEPQSSGSLKFMGYSAVKR